MFESRYRVYYEDTDASGVMYHARYLAFFERARTEYLRHLGFSQETLLREHGLAFTLSDLSVQYKQAARLDDEVVIDVLLSRIGPASIQFQQNMYRGPGKSLLSTAQVRAGCVQCASFKATRMPAAIRKALENPPA